MPENFWIAPEDIEKLAKRLIAKHHREAQRASICYVMREKHAQTGDKVQMGTCARQDAKHKLLAGFDFIITLADDIWQNLQPLQREALLLHEIKHVKVTEKEDKEGETETVFSIRKHDTEEFRDVIAVYGLWQPDLRLLAETIKSSEEGEG